MTSAAPHQVKPDQIPGVVLVEHQLHQDERGVFYEVMRKPYAQCNVSLSHYNTIRGLHLQTNRPQGKCVTVLSGIIRDVILDLRPDSETFKKWASIDLTGAMPSSVFVPPGCAHGFICKSQFATVVYHCTELYDKESDTGIYYADQELSIDWSIDQGAPLFVSERDRKLPTLAEYLRALG